MEQPIKICHLYPDILNLYGDRGNVLCLSRRLEWRHIPVEVDRVCVGEPLKAADYDLFFIGGGQDFDQEVLLPDLFSGKDKELKAAIEDGKTVLAICGGYQMLGQYYKTWDGKQIDFTGALNFYTEGVKKRMIGNYVFTFDDKPGVNIIGFENHSGKTYLQNGVRPMGKVLKGYGNNGEDGTEGVRYKNVYGTYSHGCLLPKNPAVADAILSAALERKTGQGTLPPLPDHFEKQAHDTMEKRLLG